MTTRPITTLCVFLAAASLGVGQEKTTEPPADPKKAEALYKQGLAVQKKGDVQKALDLYYQAIKADPNHPGVLNHLSWLRATDRSKVLRDGKEAVELASRACKAVVNTDKPTQFAADCLDTLAAAYAEAGLFDKAVETAKAAIDMAKKIGNRGSVRAFGKRLKLFEQNKPFHEK